MREERVILGNGSNCIFSTNPEVTGLNNNVVVVGSSGCGKTMSITEARLLETYESSLIVTVTKKRIVEKYKKEMINRGYRVMDLDFVHPEKGTVGYDPLSYISSYKDITYLAKSIVMANARKENSTADPYWDEASISLLSAEIAYVLKTNSKATFGDVLKMHDDLVFSSGNDHINTNYDTKFADLEKRDPNCFAVRCWKSFVKLPIRTASCVFGTLNTTIDTIFTPELRKMFEYPGKLDITALGERKTILFVTSSPVNPSLNCFINMFYGTVLKELFEYAEEQPDGALPIPVHLLADDFATGCPIQMFEQYISIFREKKVSVTLLLQSESQLSTMYGASAATTILNNCDTYIFMGSMDLETGYHISKRMNLPLEDVLYLPVGKEFIMRRGQKPICTSRYDIVNNPEYQRITREYQTRLEVKKYGLGRFVS